MCYSRLASAAIALLFFQQYAVHAGPLQEAPRQKLCPPGIEGTASPGATVCATDTNGTDWCATADGTGHYKIIGNATGCLPNGTYFVHDVACPTCGKSVTHTGSATAPPVNVPCGCAPAALQGTDTYAAKFICGVQQDNNITHVVDAQAGRYSTKINVHNNTGITIKFRKKIIRLRGEELPINPAEQKPLEKLTADQAMEVVCRDIYQLLKIPIVTGQIPPYIEGFVILEVYYPPSPIVSKKPPDPLDVVGVYTYKGDLPGSAGSGVSIEVVVYPVKRNSHALQ
jgi:hypothetical protein